MELLGPPPAAATTSSSHPRSLNPNLSILSRLSIYDILKCYIFSLILLYFVSSYYYNYFYYISSPFLYYFTLLYLTLC